MILPGLVHSLPVKRDAQDRHLRNLAGRRIRARLCTSLPHPVRNGRPAFGSHQQCQTSGSRLALECLVQRLHLQWISASLPSTLGRTTTGSSEAPHLLAYVSVYIWHVDSTYIPPHHVVRRIGDTISGIWLDIACSIDMHTAQLEL